MVLSAFKHVVEAYIP